MTDWITKNFLRSEYACKCGCGLDNINPILAAIIQEIRNEAGKPVYISSGCRCIPHNRREGGTSDSKHLPGPTSPDEEETCRASDLHCDIPLIDLYSIADKVIKKYNDLLVRDFGCIIVYANENFIHVDIRDEIERLVTYNRKDYFDIDTWLSEA